MPALIDRLLGLTAAPPVKNRPGPRPGAEYDEHAAQAQLMAAKRRRARDIVIPAAENPERRAACKNNCEQWCRTYLSQPPSPEKFPNERALFYGEFCEMHMDALYDFQQRIKYGGLEAFAAFRGGGKDTMATGAGMWAIFNAHCRFFVFAAYEMSQAQDRVATIKQQIEINELLCKDYPEICAPFRALERAAQRTGQQTVNGEFTRALWGADTIMLPTVAGSKASGGIIAAGSIMSSIRGLLRFGRRPDFVAITDPQTHDVARNPDRVVEILKVIKKEFGGLGSHDAPLACLAFMTIIEKDDVADQLTDREKYPQWHGKRYKALESMPAKAEMWEKYFDLMTKGAKEGDPDGRIAHNFYLKNRKAMDKGSLETWPTHFIKDVMPDGTRQEESWTQHCMNFVWRFGWDAFLSEMQNEPTEPEKHSDITPELVRSRLSMFPRMVAPEGMEQCLVQFADVGSREIHVGVMACGPTGSSMIDAYIMEVHPPAGDLRDPKSLVRKALEIQVRNRLDELKDRSRSEVTPYLTAAGDPLPISLSMVDARWLTETVLKFVKAAGPRWRAAMGQSQEPGNKKYIRPSKTRGEVKKIGIHWYEKYDRNHRQRIIYTDVDELKLCVHNRFLQTPGTDGALTLWGNDPTLHDIARIANHVCAEEYIVERGRWEKVKHKKFNHYFDVLVGLMAGASKMGVGMFAKEKARGGVSRRKSETKTEQNDRGWIIGRG